MESLVVVALVLGLFGTFAFIAFKANAEIKQDREANPSPRNPKTPRDQEQ